MFPFGSIGILNTDTIGVVVLQDMLAEDEGSFGTATAELQLFGSGIKAGEQWASDGNAETFRHLAIDPGSAAGLYQVKWDGLSGDDPDDFPSTPEGEWESLALDNFNWQMSVAGDNEKSASITVSIRLGDGPAVLDTAVWSITVISTKT